MSDSLMPHCLTVADVLGPAVVTRRCRYCDTVIPAHRRRRLYCHKGCRYAWHDLARTRRSA